jgi:2-dehydro-3-deoxyphosphooctonate aldolase (KDO 8-P synthase)
LVQGPALISPACGIIVLTLYHADVADGFQVGDVTVGGGSLFLIAGPCVIESEAHALKMAEAIAAIARQKNLPYIFKASYDKANRTSIRSFRGPGLDEGLRILRKVQKTAKVPVLTDVHEAVDVPRAAEAVDVIQIPAFLCRQTDLLVAAGKSGVAVNIKKGQFVAPWDMRHAVEKVRDAGGHRVFLTERGASFGYNNLVVDMRSLAIMRRFAPVVFDATHSVQLPSAGTAPPQPNEGWNGAPEETGDAGRSRPRNEKSGSNKPVQSGGQPEFIPLLARAAVAAGVDGVFLEVHDNPAQAKSDGANALDLKLLPDVLDQLVAIHIALK